MDIRQVIRKILKEEVGKITTKDTKKAKELANAGVDVELTEEERLAEILDKNSELKDYIDDFSKSDAPQFDGKSDDKKRNMAIAAYLNEKKVDEGTCGYGIDGKIGKTPASPKLITKKDLT